MGTPHFSLRQLTLWQHRMLLAERLCHLVRILWQDPGSALTARAAVLTLTRQLFTSDLAQLQIMKSDEDVRMISAEAPVLFERVSHPCAALERVQLRAFLQGVVDSLVAGGFQGSDPLLTLQQLHLEAVFLQVAKGWACGAR